MPVISDYVPAIEQVDERHLGTVLPDLTEVPLRRAIMEDSSLKEDVVGSLLSTLDIDPKARVRCSASARTLDLVYKANTADLCLAVGAAACADKLALEAARNLASLESVGITREVVRAALAHRSLSIRNLPFERLTRPLLEEEGNFCLRCWLDAQTNALGPVLGLRFPPAVARDQSELSRLARVQLTQAVLKKMASKKETV